MFTVVTPTTSLSLDDHFIKRPAATFFVTVEGGGMAEHGILAGDTLIVDRSRIEPAPRLPMAACPALERRRSIQLSLCGPAVPAPSGSVTPARARA